MRVSPPKERLLHRVEDRLDLPNGTLIATPRIELCGDRRAAIEGCESILECDENCIRLRTSIGVLRIHGQGLRMDYRTAEHAVVSGKLSSVEFL